MQSPDDAVLFLHLPCAVFTYTKVRMDNGIAMLVSRVSKFSIWCLSEAILREHSRLDNVPDSERATLRRDMNLRNDNARMGIQATNRVAKAMMASTDQEDMAMLV
jgi:hypothetical protein